MQPKTAEWYRSQVTKADLDLATTGKTADGHPIIDYDKVYPPTHPRKGQPILKMLDAGGNIVYSDLTAIITGPKHGRFDCADCPDFKANPSYPDRSQPYREFAIHYHDDFVTTQAFSPFSIPGPVPIDDLTFTLRGGATSSRSTTASAASAPKCGPTASRSVRCTTAGPAGSRSSS